MISKRDLLRRIENLERGQTLAVPIVDEDGGNVPHTYFPDCGIWETHLYKVIAGEHCAVATKRIPFSEVCRALQDMCGIEITYQEIKGKSGVVIYEKDD